MTRKRRYFRGLLFKLECGHKVEQVQSCVHCGTLYASWNPVSGVQRPVSAHGLPWDRSGRPKQSGVGQGPTVAGKFFYFPPIFPLTNRVLCGIL